MSIISAPDLTTLIKMNGFDLTAAESAVLTIMHSVMEQALKDYIGYDIEQGEHTEFLPAQSSQFAVEGFTGAYEGSEAGALPVFEGQGHWRELYIRHRPIRSFTSVHENLSAWDVSGVGGTGDWPAAAVLTEGSEFVADWEEPGICWSGKLIRNGAWSRVARTVRVIYTAGLTEEELASNEYAVFRHAALFAVIANMHLLKALAKQSDGFKPGPITSESLADWSASYSGSFTDMLSMNFVLPAVSQNLLGKYVNTSRYIS